MSLTRKINSIVIHHSAFSQPDNDKAFNSINASHKSKLHPKQNGYGYHVAYHYLIFENGEIMKTRPLNEIGYHAGNFPINQASIGICLIGNFENTEPSNEQIETLDFLVAELESGVNIERIYTHQEVRKGYTACPGKNLMQYVIKLDKSLRETAEIQTKTEEQSFNSGVWVRFEEIKQLCKNAQEHLHNRNKGL